MTAKVPRRKHLSCHRSWTRSCACVNTWSVRAVLTPSAHPRVHLTPLPYAPPLEPFSKLIDLPLPCTRPPGHTTKHPPCRSFATVDAPSCLPGATPPFRCVPQLWFVPTLLRISRFQHHPWVWYAGRRSRRVRVARDTLSCRSHRACIQSCRVPFRPRAVPPLECPHCRSMARPPHLHVVRASLDTPDLTVSSCRYKPDSVPHAHRCHA